MAIVILTYLAQNDLSGGATPSPSPFSPTAVSSENTGVLLQIFWSITYSSQLLKQT